MLNKIVIMISRDALIMRHASEVRRRIESYGDLFKELHVLVVGGNLGSIQVIRAGSLKNVVIHYMGKSSIWSLFKAYRKSINIFNSKKGDSLVVTTQDPFETGLVGWLLKKRLGVVWQAQIHTDFNSVFFKKESLKNRVRVLLASFILPLADSIRVMSNRIKKSLIEKNNINKSIIKVLPVWIDFNSKKGIKKIKVADDKFVILMASRLTKEKNIEMAIKVLGGVARKYMNVLMVIVGEGKEKNNLEKLAADLNLKKHIMFEGWQDDLRAYFKRADLYLLTSLYEGYGRTVLEAVYNKVPVVMTDVGVAGEIIKDRESGRVVPVYNRILLEKALLDLIKDGEARGKYSNEAFNSLKIMTKNEYLEAFKNSLDL
ncbi:MAG: hypothetical protein COV57_02930 [Candidatus Liptonbacteria bacterium CG11_big_fil_rev_8_21_14_0_20_35_14]|uniref:Glycosyl transferase family 1 domain-containing protein n=1 Tax=Candidatus Liptonbacteria bacterium CG11_big_fil_rev_8_21_14_0_20_35_14 TaxID=1974634 RepID=A0A2H0N999_9BACT|nr:MAG: hypothetical protein COV57_02930 [Candidatus Liptonbacteria bacterium CG11_big_fil_rev_8_21_14_0_20_35_14]